MVVPLVVVLQVQLEVVVVHVLLIFFVPMIVILQMVVLLVVVLHMVEVFLVDGRSSSGGHGSGHVGRQVWLLVIVQVMVRMVIEV